ncbi:hypothetical protein [Deferrisoma palaeochoriense]
MVRQWLVRAALPVVALVVAGPAGAWGLSGLESVRVEVAVEEGADPLDAEVELLRALQEAGVSAGAAARARLRLDLVPVDGGWSAGLVLTQPLCLERDPLQCADQPTWVEVATDRKGADPISLVGEVAARFVAAWRRANPRASD